MMLTKVPHLAHRVFFSCIDDRLTAEDNEFIGKHEGAFHPAMAGGAAAIIDPETKAVAVRQIIAPYLLVGATEVYLESHTDCGAYRLAGITFNSPASELARLQADLNAASAIITTALIAAGASATDIEIYTRIVDPAGSEQYFEKYEPNAG